MTFNPDSKFNKIKLAYKLTDTYDKAELLVIVNQLADIVNDCQKRIFELEQNDQTNP